MDAVQARAEVVAEEILAVWDRSPDSEGLQSATVSPWQVLPLESTQSTQVPAS
ncbi:hypothetical protein ACIQ7Q_24975 [Streptomyces sp. NPDC096176]|uniref:hypothetical protein n=1 Tax=Streptomyces sp. NPDC096176 TaxID=3366079 RepID=UPI0037F40562